MKMFLEWLSANGWGVVMSLCVILLSLAAWEWAKQPSPWARQESQYVACLKVVLDHQNDVANAETMCAPLRWPRDPANGRLLCAPEHPMPPDSTGQWSHSGARCVRSGDYVDSYRCDDCGKYWSVELPE